MKNRSVVQRKRISDVFWNIFPRSVMLGWDNPEQEAVIIHFFGSDDNNFICVRGVWWQFVSRDAGYLCRTEWDNEWVEQYEIDFLARVDPPVGVIYCHSSSKIVERSFSPEDRDQIEAMLYDCLYGWVW